MNGLFAQMRKVLSYTVGDNYVPVCSGMFVIGHICSEKYRLFLEDIESVRCLTVAGGRVDSYLKTMIVLS
jgi:hypothetical protein